MISSTTTYLFNENGLLKQHEVDEFCNILLGYSQFSFAKLLKDENKRLSPVFIHLSTPSLTIELYDNGYSLTIEGEILEVIHLLYEIDNILNSSLIYYISPSQQIWNNPEFLYPRGASVIEIGNFLDSLFHNKDYTNALTLPPKETS